MIFRLFAALAFGLACAVLASAQHTPEYFRYRPEKISVGTVHHYVKTNIDGSQPEHVSLYVAARDRIESFKFHPPRPGRAALVIAEMDWQTFSARRLESWQVFANDERKLFATLDYLPAEQSVSVSIPSTGKPTEKTRIGRLPFHVYNFDLASLNFAFRHLVDPRRGFTVGLADPTFQEQGPVFRYRGEATVTYVGDERRGGAPCRKYRAGGDGLDQRGGFIWVNRRGGYFQDVEIELPDNSAWQSFKFRLKGVGRRSAAGGGKRSSSRSSELQLTGGRTTICLAPPG